MGVLTPKTKDGQIVSDSYDGVVYLNTFVIAEDEQRFPVIIGMTGEAYLTDIIELFDYYMAEIKELPDSAASVNITMMAHVEDGKEKIVCQHDYNYIH